MAVPSPWAPTTLGQRLRQRDGAWFGITEVTYGAGEVQRPHAHEHPGVTVLLGGSLEVGLAGDVLACRPEGVLFKRGGDRHSTRIGAEGAQALILELRPRGGALPTPERSHWSRDPEGRRLAGAIAREFGVEDLASGLALEGLVLELLARLLRAPRAARGGGEPSWMATVEEYLRAHLHRSLGLEEVAEQVGRHPAHLSRSFRRHRGCSLGTYHRNLRLERAAESLRASELPIAAIAQEAGFFDQAHFGRCFRRWAGVTPARFRVERRA